MSTPRQTRSHGPADGVDLDHPNGTSPQSKYLDVENELAFYSSYHSTKGNKLIHFFCIPQILWSTLILMAHLPLPGTKAITFFPGCAFQPNLSLFFIAAYQIYYLLLEPIGGLTFLPVSVMMYTTATYLFSNPPSWLPLAPAVSSLPFGWMVNLASWTAQFIGHGVYEHRAPALLENPRQALVLAPFFVHLEFLFSVFGYKPDLETKVKNKAGIRIRDMNRAKKLKM